MSSTNRFSDMMTNTQNYASKINIVFYLALTHILTNLCMYFLITALRNEHTMRGFIMLFIILSTIVCIIILWSSKDLCISFNEKNLRNAPVAGVAISRTP